MFEVENQLIKNKDTADGQLIAAWLWSGVGVLMGAVEWREERELGIMS